MRLAGNSMFPVRDTVLHVDQIPLHDIVSNYETPIFLFSKKKIIENCAAFTRVVGKYFKNHAIYYSAKTNYSPEVMSIVRESGLNVQVVSMKERGIAINAGFSKSQIILDGIFHEVDMLQAGVNDDSIIMTSWIEELKVLEEMGRKHGSIIPVGLRFSFPREDRWLGLRGDDDDSLTRVVELLASSSCLDLQMLACHPGSQVIDEEMYRENGSYLASILEKLETWGVDISHASLNLGGGFPEAEIASDGKLSRIMDAIRGAVQHLGNVRVCFEPGRFIISDAGAIVTTIKQVFKDRRGNRWALLDAGMDVLSRFSNSHYRLFSVEHAAEPHGTPTSFQGRLPTEQDVFRKGLHFSSQLKNGEHVVILNCGAYSRTFSRRFSYTYPSYIIIDGSSTSKHEFP
ncbi:MAG: diaminopimelate decarboxylase family protein [Promethearchaeota archaeon]